MTRVLWTPQARTDLRKIHDYVARDSLQYATLVVAELLAAGGPDALVAAAGEEAGHEGH